MPNPLMEAAVRKPSRVAGSPSADEAITWLTDALLVAGVIGYSDDYIAPEYYVKYWSIGELDKGPQEDFGNALDLPRLLDQSHTEEKLRNERVAIVNGDKLLRQDAKREVFRRLLAADKSERVIEQQIGKSPTLMTMVRYLYEVQHPRPPPIKTIWCRVCTGLPGTSGLVPLRLPINASIQAVYHLLRQFVVTEMRCASTDEVPDAELERILSSWRYQLMVVKPNGKYALKVKSRVSLVDDATYRSMIEKIMDWDRQILIPFLTPVNAVVPNASGKTESPLKTSPKRFRESSQNTSPSIVPTTGVEISVQSPNHESPDTIGKPSPPDDLSPPNDEEADEEQAWEQWKIDEDFKPVNWKEVVKRVEEGEDVLNGPLPEDWGR